MNLLRALLSAVACAALSLAHPSALAQTSRLEALSLDLPQGYALAKASAPFEIKGPDGLSLNVTLVQFQAKDKTTGELSKAPQERVLAANERVFAEFARKGGEVVVPRSSETLSEGTVLQYMGVEEQSLLRRTFRALYLLVSPTSRVAFVSTQVSGDFQPRNAEILQMLRSARWSD